MAKAILAARGNDREIRGDDLAAAAAGSGP